MEQEIKINRRRVFSFFMIIILALGTALFFYIKKNRSEQHIHLYFTNYRKNQLILEERLFKFTPNKVNDIKRVLEELSYGPMSYRLEPLLSHNTVVLDVWKVNKTVYVNLNASAFIKSQKPDLAVMSINRTVFSNFKEIDSIRYIIDSRNVATVTGFEDLSITYQRRAK